MPLGSGTRLGPYEILSALGAGGMGEVWRARDTRLDRIVAIKVLPAHVSSDPAFRERFDREARTIAALNHPHICTLHDIGEDRGTSFLVMEHLEGETLEQRLKKGALPVDQALKYAIEIADALDKAHRAGIVHRDLKPANIMLTRSGAGSTSALHAKLLDFGLAKVTPTVIATAGLSMAPTGLSPATMQGTILGTLQYMAPEQIEGQEADARTDIFGFGCVLYEMVTGAAPFEGRTQASLIGAILRDTPPPVTTRQPTTPARLERVIEACLAKDPDERWQSTADLKRELKWLQEAAPETAAASAPPTTVRRGWMPWSAAALFFVGAVAMAAIHYTEKPPAAAVPFRFQVRLPDKVSFARTSTIALSPDGRTVAFIAVGIAENEPHIWVQKLDGTEAHALVNTDVGLTAPPPFWSPDSQFVVYSGFAKVRKVNVATGVAQDLCDKPGPVVGGSWNSDDVVIFGGNTTGLWKTTAAGGKPTPLTILESSWHEREHELPQFLPDGRHFLYLRVSDQPERTGIYAGSIDEAPERQSKQRILETGFGVTFVASPDGKAGQLLSFRDGTVTAQRFNPGTLQVEGEPQVVVDHVNAVYETPEFGASSDLFAYRQALPGTRYQFTLVDDAGKRLGTLGEPMDEVALPAFSPDGSRVAYARGSGNGTNRDIWLLDVTRGVSMRFTFGMGDNTWPFWSPDGRQVVFSSNRNGGAYSLFTKPADGSKPEQLLLKTTRNTGVTSWSPDGSYLLFEQQGDPTSIRQMWRLPLAPVGEPILLTSSSFNEATPRLSPDGRWLAYSSNETGRQEIYVREFMPGIGNGGSGGKSIVSKDGGYWPMWRNDGKELWFLASDRTKPATLMAVSVNPERGMLHVGVPRTVFDLPPGIAPTSMAATANVAFAADLKRFVLPLPVEDTPAPVFTVLANWAPGMKAKAN